jgi:hypothetical protein
VVATAVTIVTVGVFGPHPGGQSPVTTPAPPTPERSSASAEAAVPSPSLGWTTALALPRLSFAPSDVAHSDLPAGVGTASIARIGSRLFYVVAGDRIESSVIGSPAAPDTVVRLSDCEAIGGLAAAGESLMYVATSPEVQTMSGCVGSDASGNSRWEIWLLDLLDGSRRRLAGGIRTGTLTDRVGGVEPIALSPNAYAFSRALDPADPPAGGIVEVDAIDGTLLWTSRTEAPVTRLMLGGGRLAVLTGAAGATQTGLALWVSDAHHPAVEQVAEPLGSAALSADGAYLAWDATYVVGLHRASALPILQIENAATGEYSIAAAPATADPGVPARPAVSSNAFGPLVAWLTAASDGTVYPAVRFEGGILTPGAAAGAVFLDSPQRPVWLDISETTMYWVVERPDGRSAAAYAAELPAG